jgi:hypothetical protein
MRRALVGSDRLGSGCLVLRADTRENPGGKNGVMTIISSVYTIFWMITMCCEVSYLYIELLTQLSYLTNVGYLNRRLSCMEMVILCPQDSLQEKRSYCMVTLRRNGPIDQKGPWPPVFFFN